MGWGGQGLWEQYISDEPIQLRAIARLIVRFAPTITNDRSFAFSARKYFLYMYWGEDFFGTFPLISIKYCNLREKTMGICF